ncbi:MAG: asparagine synthase (glutamine-hydrolyzing) [Alphaproteobacteria bacterium]
MCGIAGLLSPNPPARDLAGRVGPLMRTRGPDAFGEWSGRLGRSWLSLLHARLAIIDLDPRANQPFVAEGCVLAFNGEIYNYRELRDELAAAGHRFATRSDTEVLVHAWRQWGEGCFARLEGMWALALYDERREVLVLSRDPFGEKPLYWTMAGGALAFASEVKYLPGLTGHSLTPDHTQLRRYLVNGYRALCKQPATFFADVAELPAGTFAVIEAPAAPSPRSYWQLDFAPAAMERRDAEAGAAERLQRAVELRLRADVPVAFCLSGGVDSTVLAGIAAKRCGQRIHAFSIVDSDPRYDERDNIGSVVADLGCDSHVVHTTRDGFLDRLARQVAYHDAPVATISYYVHEFLSEAIAAHGYKVAISGTGADELFTGYHDHYVFWLAQMADRPDFASLLADWRAGYGATVRNPLLRDPHNFVRDPRERGHIYLDRATFDGLLREPFAEDFFEQEYCADTLRNRMLNELRHEVVPVILHEDDLDSMAWSVENRSPYLDRELARFLFTVPTEHLVHDGMAKWLLRAAGEGVVPDGVRLDRRKRGFNASIDSLLDRGDPQVRERLLAPGPIFDIVDRDRFRTFLDGDMSDNARSKFLFSFVSARLFLETDLASGRRPRAEAA